MCQKERTKRCYQKQIEKQRTGNQDKYYLGKLCKNGHDWEGSGKSLRRTIGNGCIFCHRENLNRWRKNNLEEVRKAENEYNRLPHRREIRRKYAHQKYYENHADSLRKKAEWRRKNIEKQINWERNYYWKNREKKWGLAGIRAKWDTMQSFVKILALIPIL